MGKNTALRVTIINGLIAALYFVLSLISNMAGLAAGPIQIRFSEALNHLVAFNKKYFWGVVVGVLIFNALQSTIYDAIFGTLQTVIALGIVALTNRYIAKVWTRMALNTVLFTVTMCIVAWVIVYSPAAEGTPSMGAFWTVYGSLAISEFVMMAVSAPIMYVIDKLVHFNARMEG